MEKCEAGHRGMLNENKLKKETELSIPSIVTWAASIDIISQLKCGIIAILPNYSCRYIGILSNTETYSKF